MIFNYLKYSSYFIFLLACSLLWSCHDDDPASTPFVVNLATVNIIDSDNGSYYFTLDDGSTLISKTNLSKFSFKNKQRVFLNYTTLANTIDGFDHQIEINNISNVLTKNVIDRTLTTQENEALGNDPTKIVSLWVGDKYLNFRFKFLVGGDKVTHDVNLVCNGIRNDSIFLSFRHNANKDAERFEQLAYAAFNLRSFGDSLSDNTTLIVETINLNEKVENYTLKYSDDNNTANNITDNEFISGTVIK